jgi:hypothetical protein
MKVETDTGLRGIPGLEGRIERAFATPLSDELPRATL